MDATFPPLELTASAWEGTDLLPEWARLQSRGGPYASQDGAGPSDGRAGVDVLPPGGASARRPPAPEQAAATRGLKEGGAALRDAVLPALLAYAQGFTREDEPLPDDLESLKAMIGLGTVHVLDVAKDGVADVGLELGCDWDEEHGCGVLTRAGRVVGVGRADTSFLGWIAENDGGSVLA